MLTIGMMCGGVLGCTGRAAACTHFHPASAILLAYIFPMSPMPMMPTTASSMLAVSMLVAQQRRV